MKPRQFCFRTSLFVYLIGLAALLAREQYSFHFFLLNLFYPVSRWAMWALTGGAITAVVVGILALGTTRRRRQRRRIWVGWALMLLAGIATAILINH